MVSEGRDGAPQGLSTVRSEPRTNGGEIISFHPIATGNECRGQAAIGSALELENHLRR